MALMITFSSLVAAEIDGGFSFKRLLMPGELAEGHRKYEQECSHCHEAFRKTTQTQLCLDCHERVADDIDKSRGFHGRLNGVPNHNCQNCHSEHLGRQADIVNLDKDTFNHSLTDFKLTEKHIGVLCVSCHLPQKKYRNTSSQCFDCHKSIDKHNEALGKECKDCHSTKGWKENLFDHNDTQFRLFGRHQKTQCNACHPDEKYTDTSTTCFSCHVFHDVHNGLNGQQCNTCHNESDWAEVSFDHDKDTSFLLQDGHDQLACDACHKKSKFKPKTSTLCASCHTKDDEHNGRNGKLCDSCHVTTHWDEIIFDHARDTDFNLLGAHNDLSCESCHRDMTNNSSLGTTCIDCHLTDDVHKGQEGKKCNNCHKSSGWADELRFNHDLSHFPLVGMHAVTSCASCHSSKMFRDAESDCIACHIEDDTHNRSLGTDCATCHNPNDWRLWLFEHKRQTDFKFDGAHISLSCDECHIKPAKFQVKQSSACVACHLNDDVHYQRFGRACDRCHSTDSFKEVRIK